MYSSFPKSTKKTPKHFTIVLSLTFTLQHTTNKWKFSWKVTNSRWQTNFKLKRHSGHIISHSYTFKGTVKVKVLEAPNSKNTISCPSHCATELHLYYISTDSTRCPLLSNPAPWKAHPEPMDILFCPVYSLFLLSLCK